MECQPRKGIRFEPWRGCHYGSPNSFGLPERLLVLGESHYGEQEQDRSDITENVVKEVFAEDVDYRYRFFTSVFKALCSAEREATRAALEEFCHAIAFYNFVQYILNKGARPEEWHWRQSEAPFLECLDRLGPSHVVACGFTLWDNMPDRNYSRLSDGIEQDILGLLPDQGKRQSDRSQPGNWVGRYKHSGGSCVILRMKHPSVAFSADQWRPVLQRFFKLQAA